MDILQLDSLTQSLAVTVPDQGFPEVIYWGPKLSDKLPIGDASRTRKPLPGSKLIEYTPVSIIPEYGRGFFGHPGLEVIAVALDGPRSFSCNGRSAKGISWCSLGRIRLLNWSWRSRFYAALSSAFSGSTRRSKILVNRLTNLNGWRRVVCRCPTTATKC